MSYVVHMQLWRINETIDVQLQGVRRAILGRQQQRRPRGDGHHHTAGAVGDVSDRAPGQRQDPSAHQGTKWALLAGNNN
jgi:hypothetical protein